MDASNHIQRKETVGATSERERFGASMEQNQSTQLNAPSLKAAQADISNIRL